MDGYFVSIRENKTPIKLIWWNEITPRPKIVPFFASEIYKGDLENDY